MAKPVYRRVVVKVSGEALMGSEPFGIHQPRIEQIAADLIASSALGAALGVVVGGGNFLRGAQAAGHGVPRVSADTMGMLATVMNALALNAALEKAGGKARVLSALSMPEVCETYEPRRAAHLLNDGLILLLAGGTGNPFFTTDTTAVLRAAELGADAVLKATNVDGVYDDDPKKKKDAVRFERLTHGEALQRNLKVMDATAFALARENRIPIIVFSIGQPGAIGAVLRGEGRATVVAD